MTTIENKHVSQEEHIPNTKSVPKTENIRKTASINAALSQSSFAITRQNTPECKLSPQRWLILLLYCLLTLSASSVWFSFTSVTNILKSYYSCSLLAINFLSIIFGISILIFALFFSFLLEKYELAVVLNIAAVLNGIGALVRYFGSNSDYGYSLLVIGNAFTATSLAAFMFLPGKIASNWFGESESGKAVAICIGFDFVGTGLGFLHATSMIKNHSQSEEVERDLKNFLLSQLVPALLIIPLFIIVVRKRPKYPPSRMEASRLENLSRKSRSTPKDANQNESAVTQGAMDISTASYRKSIIALLKNRDFLLIMNIHGITQTVEGLFETLLNEILIKKFPGREWDIGVLGFVAIILGFVSNISMGVLSDRYKSHKTTSIMIFSLTAVFCIAWTILLECSDNFIVTAVMFCCLMFFCTAYYTVAFAHAFDATYPLSTGLTGVMLIVTSQIYNSAFMFAVTEILSRLGVLGVNITALVLVFIAVILALCLKKRPPLLVSTKLVEASIKTLGVNQSVIVPRKSSSFIN